MGRFSDMLGRSGDDDASPTGSGVPDGPAADVPADATDAATDAADGPDDGRATDRPGDPVLADHLDRLAHLAEARPATSPWIPVGEPAPTPPASSFRVEDLPTVDDDLLPRRTRD